MSSLLFLEASIHKTNPRRETSGSEKQDFSLKKKKKPRIFSLSVASELFFPFSMFPFSIFLFSCFSRNTRYHLDDANKKKDLPIDSIISVVSNRFSKTRRGDLYENQKAVFWRSVCLVVNTKTTQKEQLAIITNITYPWDCNVFVKSYFAAARTWQKS